MIRPPQAQIVPLVSLLHPVLSSHSNQSAGRTLGVVPHSQTRVSIKITLCFRLFFPLLSWCSQFSNCRAGIAILFCIYFLRGLEGLFILRNTGIPVELHNRDYEFIYEFGYTILHNTRVPNVYNLSFLLVETHSIIFDCSSRKFTPSEYYTDYHTQSFIDVLYIRSVSIHSVYSIYTGWTQDCNRKGKSPTLR